MFRKVENVRKFIDFYKNEVTFSFVDHPFSKTPKHVWIICKYKDKWLLTKHKERGIEFPGGKVEHGETAVEGAIREIKEETGGITDEIHYVGQFFVAGKRDQVIKNVYFAKIKKLTRQPTYYETDGPVLLTDIPENVKQHHSFSFMMKDNVLPYAMEQIKEKHLN